MSAFTGFPDAALDFYDDLEVDNTKSFWEKHKRVYTESVRQPMTALCEALAPEFGDAKVFRPYRDVRFAKDKTPYKEHAGAVAHDNDGSTGLYVQFSADGLYVAGGSWHLATDQPSASSAPTIRSSSVPVRSSSIASRTAASPADDAS